MKKKLAFLLFLTATMVFAIGVNVTSHASEGSGNSNADALNNVIAKYVDETATYVKETKIFLNDEAITELEINGGFHAGVSTLERTTYYKGSELWMSREDGKYSYYGTAEGNTGVTNATADKPLVTPADAKVVLSGEGKNSMQEYYVGLEDIVAKDAHNWTYADGVYTTTSEEVIEWFKAFTAPCYLGFTTAEVKNYITLDKATISCEGYDLVLKLYASQDGGKLTSEGGVFSQAKILFNVESVFTSEVLENKYILDMPSYDVTIDFYAVKDSNRLYVKADYYVKEPHTTGEWWQQDNFELRLNTPTGFITNGKAYNPSFFGIIKSRTNTSKLSFSFSTNSIPS